MPITRESLIDHLFNSHPGQVWGHIKDQSAEQRADLFPQVEQLLAVADEACTGRYDSVNRTSAKKLAAWAVSQEPRGVKKAWKERSGPGHLERKDLRRVVINFLVLKIGLAPEGKARAGLRAKHRPRDEMEWFLKYAVGALLCRPEPWAPALLAEFVEKPEKHVQDPFHLDLLLAAAWNDSRFRAAVAPHAERAMGAFAIFQKALHPDLLLAALRFAGPLPQDRYLHMSEEYVHERIRGLLASGHLPRERMIELALEKLREKLPQNISKHWLALFDHLALTGEERALHRERYLDLINAPMGKAATMGLAEVAESFKGGAWPAEELVPALAPAMFHPVGSVALKVLRLLFAVDKKDGGAVPGQVAEAAADALSSPHKAVRVAAGKWLVKQKDLDPVVRARVADAVELLDPRERGSLAEAFAEAAPVDDATPEPTVDLSRIAARAAGLDLDAAARSWLTCLECGAAPAPVGLPPAAQLQRPFPLLGSAEELAHAMVAVTGRDLAADDLERILDGVCRFWDHGPDERLRKITSPLTGRAATWDGEPEWNWLPRGACSTAEPLVATLAHGWHTGGELLRYPPGSRGDKCQDMFPSQRRRARLALRELGRGGYSSLATPTHGGGWIDPGVLAQRIATLGADRIHDEEVIAALYRLADVRPGEAAWDAAEPALCGQTTPEALALTVALASAGEADRAAAALLSLIEPRRANPLLPRDNLAKVMNAAATLVQAVGKERPAGAGEGMIRFRLLVAASRARAGLGDAREALPCLASDHAREVAGRYIDLVSADQKVDRALVDLLLHPEPVNGEVMDRTRLSSYYNYSCLAYSGTDTALPSMLPYIAAVNQLRTDGDPFDDRLVIHCHVWEHPRCAQRLFEAGAHRVFDRPHVRDNHVMELGKNSVTVALTGVGAFPWVDPGPWLDAVCALMTSKFPGHRQRAADLLLIWLGDGRATAAQLADALARVAAGAARGAKYLCEALVELAADGPAGAAVAIMALERALPLVLGKLEPRPVGIMLETLYLLLEEQGRVVEHPAGRAALEAAAGAKKASSVRKKAREVDGLTARAAPPLEQALAAHLLEAWMERTKTQGDASS